MAQRVLILSRLGRVSRVLGGTQHPALPLRAVSPASAFGPWLPRLLRTRPRRPRPIGSARPRSQGVGGAGRIQGGKAMRKELCAPAKGGPARRRVVSVRPEGRASPRLTDEGGLRPAASSVKLRRRGPCWDLALPW